MARVRVESIVDHLSSEFRRALEAAVEETAPGVDIDVHELFRNFRRAVNRKCNTWETVPDGAVEK